MGMPSTGADNIFEQLLQDLPSEIIEQAVELKAFKRSRKIKSAKELLRMVLMFSGLDMTEREVAANLLLTNPRLKRLSDQAVHKRLVNCDQWLKSILLSLIDMQPLRTNSAGRRIIVVDGTSVRAPGATQTSYRLHVRMDLLSLQLSSIAITTGKTGEKLRLLEVEGGNIYLADRGYCCRQDVDYVLTAGGDVIVRFNPNNFPICNASGEGIDIAEHLRKIKPGERATLSVNFENKKGEIKPVWIHCLRLTGRALEVSRRRCNRGGQQCGYKPSERTLMINEFVLVLSTIAPEELDAKAVLEIYRCRWQIELLIKRWKSLLSLDRLRARQSSPSCNIYLIGKLLYALLLERRMRNRFGNQSGQMDQKRERTCWRLWKLMRQEINPIIAGVSCWFRNDWQSVIKAITERQSNRLLQRIPIKVAIWLAKQHVIAEVHPQVIDPSHVAA
jgi:hypothetical protein